MRLNIIRSLFCTLLLSVGLLVAQPISNEVILGEWIISTKVTSDDTVSCKEQCTEVTFLENKQLNILTSMGDENNFRWLIIADTLHLFPNDKRRKRTNMDLTVQFPDEFTIVDITEDEKRSFILRNEKLKYHYILTPLPPKEDE